MIGLGSDTEFYQAGVRTVLDIGCGFGSFGSHLLSLKLMVVWIAAYEVTGSQVQLALERGLPAIIGNFISRQLPYPSLSFSMVQYAQCGIFWEEKGHAACVLVYRVLMHKFVEAGQKKMSGVQPNDFCEDFENWKSIVRNYWSLLTPLIFSDHPKRPGDEDPLPPYNMICNVMDMNAHYGGLNAACLEGKQSGWVIVGDKLGPIEKACSLATQIRWDARIFYHLNMAWNLRWATSLGENMKSGTEMRKLLSEPDVPTLDQGSRLSQAVATFHEFKFLCAGAGEQNSALYWLGRVQTFSLTVGEKTDYLVKIQELQKQLAMDKEEDERFQGDRDNFLSVALEGYKLCLVIDDKYDVRVVFRLVSLWFSLSSRQIVVNGMLNTIEEVQSYKFIPLVYQIASRMGSKDGHGPHSFQFSLASLVKKVAI
ncbi:hypothetical protein RHMOL_Rhmol06G0176900 [Rhododendron molle]|uniref:Uncharacterized protein n=1 Tax=Rhododendron molle TaxID=49168 RepID=A0ACC0NFQ6_RHOML|nr:hypothetical protein RHMOL_Rhmol06G0176900 [Rhododendron molle]